MSEFIASTIECYEEDGVVTIALGDDPIDPNGYIVITRLDDEDNIYIDEGIGFQTAQSSHEVANSIDEVILHSDGLEVVVKQEFIGHCGAGRFFGRFPDEINSSKEKVALLRSYLKDIFDGSHVRLIM
ncbi:MULTISPECIES: hypothetical protein [Pseudomonas]|uniref:Uncharacterized protein n=1 Tax=Pseudomonas putida TaxID=303 RepID=A0A7Y8D5P9_PSEPU|nr:MULTISPECIES: hypothetical protein [Pseudomonas]MBG6128303.1 hypothetical protein [Pseudomonas sp. M2]NSX19343.1 hypothetical protein [Pseudomonas putida]NWC83748.1 hypothetical protein [Pseudomonas putida]HDS1744170.1 hypothetical protein [Pseudomonas putida]